MKMGQLIPLHTPGAIDELSDHALAIAAGTGDGAAQSLVFRRHAPAVYRFLSRMTASRTDAEDLLQATFLAAFRTIATFRGARLSSWLVGVAANTARGYIRKEISRRRLHAAVAETLDETTSNRDADVPALRAAIAALPLELREVIVLVDLEGERGADVARMLDIGESTLWDRLSKARAKLRAALGGKP